MARPLRLLAGCTTFVATLAACKAASPTRPPIDLARVELVNLTWPFDQHTLYWPSSPGGFELHALAHGATPGGWFYASNTFCAPEHGGTHLDAPIHFAEGRRTADRIPLTQLVAPVVVIDVSAAAARDPDYRLTAADVRAWETEHGRIEAGTIALLHTGWGARWSDRKAYFGDDAPGATDDLHFPSFGEEAAQLLVGERRVAAIGVDTASLDHGPSRDFRVHRVAAAADVPGLENVAHLARVPARGAWLIALPMKIAGGSGGPVRIVAAVPRG